MSPEATREAVVAAWHRVPPGTRRPAVWIAADLGVGTRTVERAVAEARRAGLLPGGRTNLYPPAKDPAECLLCQEVAWLLDAGEVKYRVAERIGYTYDSLRTHLYRHNTTLAAKFLAASYPEEQAAHGFDVRLLHKVDA